MFNKILLIFIFLSLPLPGRANPVSKNKLKEKKPSKASDPLPRKTTATKESSSAKDKQSHYQFGLGGGLQSVFIPSIGFEGFISTGNLHVGAELGFFQLSQSQFKGATSFMGICGRWQLNRKQPFFIGGSLGTRGVSLTTYADLSYTDQAQGSTTNTNIAWTRKISQMLFYPKAGWMWATDHSAIIAATGLLIPVGSKASISGSPPSADGISDSDYQAAAESKLKDVTKTTNAVMPSIEVKYLRFLN